MPDRNLTSVWALQQHRRVSAFKTVPQGPSSFPPSPWGAWRCAEAILQWLPLHPPQQSADSVSGGHPEEEDQQCVQHLSGGAAPPGGRQRGQVLLSAHLKKILLTCCSRKFTKQKRFSLEFCNKCKGLLWPFKIYKWFHLLVMKYLFPSSWVSSSILRDIWYP